MKFDGSNPVAPIPIRTVPPRKEPVKKDAKTKAKRKVLERVAETISKLCEKVECGTASGYEMETLVDLVKAVTN